MGVETGALLGTPLAIGEVGEHYLLYEEEISFGKKKKSAVKC